MNMVQQSSIPAVAIIGGGFTGASVALHLARACPSEQLRIVVFEPRERFGAGLAYDTREPVHRINVPPLRMSVFPEDPESFLRWLEANDALRDDPDAFKSPNGLPYPRRELFGQFVADVAAPHLASGAIEHWRSRAVSAVPHADGWRITAEDGRSVDAWRVVLAVSHPPPALPSALQTIREHPALIASAMDGNALGQIGTASRVLVVGNGLTSADTIAALKRRGHKGEIVAVSRRGLRSRGPAPGEQPFDVDFLAEPLTRASGLLGKVRRAVREAKATGLTWHAVMDVIRIQGHDIWKALPVSERRRLARHVRPFWDVHRFRIAPQVEAVLNAAIADRSLSIMAASLQSVQPDGASVRVSLRARREKHAKVRIFDHVVVTTGPAHGGILQSQPLLANLAARGTLVSCPTGLGIHCDEKARVLDAAGKSDEAMLVAGPLARGTFGELIGIAQVSNHVAFVADRITEDLKVPAPAPVPA